MSRPSDFEENKTAFARSIDRQVRELRDITNAYQHFITHLGTLERLLRALAGFAPRSLVGDVCGSCGIDGVSVRRALRDLKEIEGAQ